MPFIVRKSRKLIRSLFDMLCFLWLYYKVNIAKPCHCEICNSGKIMVFSPYWRHPLLECENCGLRFAAFMPKIIKLKKMHDKKYWKAMYDDIGFRENPNAWEEWKKWKESLFDSLGVRLESIQKSKKSVLDVGCGNGALLELFSQKGWECVGVDFSDFLHDKSFPPEIKIINSSFESIDLAPQSFDVISLIHTLEHFRHPSKCLLKAKKYLKKDGVFFIELPQTQNYSGIHHRFFFSKKSIHLMLLNCGLEVMNKITYQDKVHPENKSVNLVFTCRPTELLA